MAIVGFNFTELSVKKASAANKGSAKVSTKVNIKDVIGQKSVVASEDAQVTKIDFEFDVVYEPNVGKIHMTGSLAYLAKKAEAENIMKDWTDNKKLPEGVTKVVMKHILDKSMIQAVIMSRDVLLPSPIPLPKINTKSKA